MKSETSEAAKHVQSHVAIGPESSEAPKHVQSHVAIGSRFMPEEDPPILPPPPPHSLRNIYFSTVSVLLYILSFGFGISYSAPAVEDMRQPGSRFRNISDDEITWFVSLIALCAVPGTAIGGYFSQRFGRKATLMLTSSLSCTGWLLIAFAPTVPTIYVGRILLGLCTGLGNVTIPAFINEMSVVEVRGFLGAGVQLMFTSGMVLVMSFGVFLRWSWLAFAGAVIVVTATWLLYFVPESPPWLVRYKRTAEAIAALKFLKGKKYNAAAEVKSIAEQMALEPQFDLTLSDLKRPTFYKPVLIAAAVIFFQQYSGVNSIMAYTVTIFKQTGSTFDPKYESVVVACVQLVMTMVGASLLDRAGRKIMFVVSGGSLTLCLTILGLYCFFIRKESAAEVTKLGWVPLVLVIACIAAYSIGFGPIPFVLMPELVPLKTRSLLLTLALIFGSGTAFIADKLFLITIQWIGIHGLFWSYGFFALLGSLFYWFIVPETKGLPADEINKFFS